MSFAFEFDATVSVTECKREGKNHWSVSLLVSDSDIDMSDEFQILSWSDIQKVA